MRSPTTPSDLRSVLMRPPLSSLGRVAYLSQPGRDGESGSTMSTGATAPVICFMLCEPLRGWRHVAVTERRRMGDFAHQMRWLADEAYTKAEKIRVVLDNLNTHRPASLYETFDPAEARRILKRLEFHYTPKHGSWLNMAEIELSVFSRQCLNRRIPDGATLTRELAALVRRRNEAHATIAWRFTTSAARTTLHHLYPTQQKSSGLTTSSWRSTKEHASP